MAPPRNNGKIGQAGGVASGTVSLLLVLYLFLGFVIRDHVLRNGTQAREMFGQPLKYLCEDYTVD